MRWAVASEAKKLRHCASQHCSDADNDQPLMGHTLERQRVTDKQTIHGTGEEVRQTVRAR